MVFRIKNIYFLLIISMFSLLLFSNLAFSKISSKESLKNYALLACFAQNIDEKEGDDPKKPFRVAADFYFQNGELPIEAYTEAINLVKKVTSLPSKDIHGNSLVLVDCINFSNSKELDDLYQKYNKQ